MKLLRNMIKQGKFIFTVVALITGVFNIASTAHELSNAEAGAGGNGAALNTKAIQSAIDQMPSISVVPADVMQKVYDEVKTPFKYGIVLSPAPGKKLDCPNVFRYGNKWFMIYVQFEPRPAEGYTTQLAVSDDLLHWKPLGTALDRGVAGAWDHANSAAGVALFDTEWGGSNTLGKHAGRYWLSYIGGGQFGYETEPLAMGLASTDDPSRLGSWEKLPAPVLKVDDPDTRPGEKGTLYKSYIFRDDTRSLGAPFVMFYNAKPSKEGDERIFAAISDDLKTWRRFGTEPVIYNPRPPGLKSNVISGDPQVIRMGGLWVMFYFGVRWKPGAFDTFACSYDLRHWTQWNGPHLIEASEPFDTPYAHKPWLIKHDGVVYHFYCAVGGKDKHRAIAVATSKELSKSTKNFSRLASGHELPLFPIALPAGPVKLAASAPTLATGISPGGHTVTNEWFSLAGNPVAAGNSIGNDGLIRKFETPVLRVTRTSVTKPKGTVLLFPGGAYKLLDAVNEGSWTAKSLNEFGYDVVMLEYHVSTGPKTRDFALADALTAWRLLNAHPNALGVDNQRSVLMGYSAGGHLAARLVQSLTNAADAKPDDLILAYPAYLDECAQGSAEPKVQPPVKPSSRLVVIMATNDRPAWVEGATNFVAAWCKAGGYGIFQSFKNGGHGFGMKSNLTGDIAQWPEVLNYFLENGPKPGVGPFNTVLPWFLKNKSERLATFQKEAAADQGAIAFLGDSITRKWNIQKAFPDLKVANRGIAGDTTRGMLCRLADTVLDLHPKAIVFMGGINDLACQPKGTPETIASNVRSILDQIHVVNPDTPVLICETLPSKSAPLETVQAVNTAVDKVIADFTNVHRVKTFAAFLKPDGTENFSLFKDGTHPNAAGYAIWRTILKPEIDKYAPVINGAVRMRIIGNSTNGHERESHPQN